MNPRPSAGPTNSALLHGLTTAALTAALAPVLWAQGRQVRRTAVELPEAEGPREGVTGQGADLRLLVLGDSAGAGVGVPTQDEALTGRLVQSLSTRHTVHWRLVARTGWRLSQVIRSAQAEPGQPAEPVDWVVVSAGINDVLRGTKPARWRDGLLQLADVLETRFQARRVAFSGIPRIEDFPLLPHPLAWYLGTRARRLNRITRDTLPHLPASWRLVDLDLPLTPDYLAQDGFHPNEAACRLWCEQVMAAVDGVCR